VQNQQNKILVHACCGVCFSYPLIFLREQGYEPVVYYFNQNIYPEDEFQRRYLELEKYSKANNFELIKEDYNHEEFLETIKGLENEPERGRRCHKCFYYRIQKTAKKAIELNIKEITTTLTISPHKISQDIFDFGDSAIKDLNVKFVKFNFKKKDGYKKTCQIAYNFGMYRQNYCGCEFSIKK